MRCSRGPCQQRPFRPCPTASSAECPLAPSPTHHALPVRLGHEARQGPGWTDGGGRPASQSSCWCRPCPAICRLDAAVMNPSRQHSSPLQARIGPIRRASSCGAWRAVRAACRGPSPDWLVHRPADCPAQPFPGWPCHSGGYPLRCCPGAPAPWAARSCGRPRSGTAEIGARRCGAGCGRRRCRAPMPPLPSLACRSPRSHWPVRSPPGPSACRCPAR